MHKWKKQRALNYLPVCSCLWIPLLSICNTSVKTYHLTHFFPDGNCISVESNQELTNSITEPETLLTGTEINTMKQSQEEYTITCKTLDMLNYYCPWANKQQEKTQTFPRILPIAVPASHLHTNQVETIVLNPVYTSDSINNWAVHGKDCWGSFLSALSFFSCNCIKIQNYLLEAKD